LLSLLDQPSLAGVQSVSCLGCWQVNLVFVVTKMAVRQRSPRRCHAGTLDFSVCPVEQVEVDVVGSHLICLLSCQGFLCAKDLLTGVSLLILRKGLSAEVKWKRSFCNSVGRVRVPVARL